MKVKCQLYRILGSLIEPNERKSGFCKTAFFCSNSSDGSDLTEMKPEAEVEVVTAENVEEVDANASSAIVPTNPTGHRVNPEVYF